MRMRLWVTASATAAAVMFSPTGACGPVYYTLTDLRTLAGYEYSRATALNDAGDVVGYAGGNEQMRAFLFSGGAMLDIGSLGGNSRAEDINNSGVVVGFSRLSTSQFDGTEGAFVYRDGVISNLGVLAPGTALARAHGINDSGQIVGDSGTGDNTSQKAFIYSAGSMELLLSADSPSPSYARAINEFGDAAGFFEQRCFGPGAWMLKGGTLTELELADNSPYPCTPGIANDINDNGAVVGRATFPGAGFRAFVYLDGEMTNLGTLGGDFSEAKAVNNQGQIVGMSPTRNFDSAFLFQDGLMYNLNAMLFNNSLGWQVVDVQDINESGQIAGEACYFSPVRICHAVRLDPTDIPYNGDPGGTAPEPATLALAALGLTALGFTRRRRQQAA